MQILYAIKRNIKQNPFRRLQMNSVDQVRRLYKRRFLTQAYKKNANINYYEISFFFIYQISRYESLITLSLQSMGPWALIHGLGGWEAGSKHWFNLLGGGGIWKHLLKEKMYISFDLVIILLEIYPTDPLFNT